MANGGISGGSATRTGWLHLSPIARFSPARATNSASVAAWSCLADLRQLHLGPQDNLTLDNALALALASVREFLVGATEGVLGGPPQRLAPEDVVVRDRDLVGHRLVGAIGLELSDVVGQSCLLVAAQPAAEVQEQPLNLELGQLESRPDVEADRQGSQTGEEGESRQTLAQPDRFAADSKAKPTHVVIRRDHGQERREHDLLLAPAPERCSRAGRATEVDIERLVSTASATVSVLPVAAIASRVASSESLGSAIAVRGRLGIRLRSRVLPVPVVVGVERSFSVRVPVT